MLRAASSQDWSDADVEDLIKSYLEEKQEAEAAGKRKVYAGAGDYFSQEDYDHVRQADDNVFSRYAAKAKKERPEVVDGDVEFDLYTETLAQIYAEQGYYDQAKSI